MKNLIGKNVKLVGKLIVTIILVAVLLRAVDWFAVWTAMKSMQWMYVGLYGLFYVFGIYISAWKWMLIARRVDFDMSYSFYVKTYLVGTFVNNFLPSFVGGDAYRVFSLGASRGRVIDATATVIMDRVSGLFVLLLYAVVLMGGIQGTMMTQSTLHMIWYGLLLCVVGGVMVVVGISRGWYRALKVVLPQFLYKNARAMARFHDKHVYGSLFFSTTIFIVVGIMMANYLLFIACGVSITFWQYASVILVTNVIAALPITVGNIGTKEWAYIFLFGFFGVSSSVLVAIVLVSRIVQLLVSLAAIPFFLQVRGLVPKKIS